MHARSLPETESACAAASGLPSVLKGLHSLSLRRCEGQDYVLMPHQCMQSLPSPLAARAIQHGPRPVVQCHTPGLHFTASHLHTRERCSIDIRSKSQGALDAWTDGIQALQSAATFSKASPTYDHHWSPLIACCPSSGGTEGPLQAHAETQLFGQSQTLLCASGHRSQSSPA